MHSYGKSEIRRNKSPKHKSESFNDASVLLYGGETWLLTDHGTGKFQNFVNRCLLKVWWPNVIGNDDLYKKYNLEPMDNYNI